MKGNGPKTIKKAMEHTLGRKTIAESTLDSGKQVTCMDVGLRLGRMAEDTTESTNTPKNMVKVSINGVMEKRMMVDGKMVSNMEKEYFTILTRNKP